MISKYNALRNVILSTIRALCLMLCSCLLFSSRIHAQPAERLVKDKGYTFTVQNIQPFRGMLRQDMQTPGYYTVKITADSLISYLPFFGRAYTATIGSTESALVFTSTKFDYNVTDRKKGGWDIMIKPRDTDKIQQMMLTVFPDGRASMRVISTSRDPMSFDGAIGAKS